MQYPQQEGTPQITGQAPNAQPLQPGYPAQTPPPQFMPGQVPMQQPYQQQPYAQGYQQSVFPQQPGMQMPMQAPTMATTVNVNVQQSGPGFFVRALYFVFIGWWAGWFWLNLGFLLCAFIVTLPVGLIMLNRLPRVMTLKPAGTKTSVNVSTTSIASPMGGTVMQQNINVTVGGTQQYNFLLRAVYFIFIGSWAGYLWANLAYLCCLTVLLLPVGIIMFDRLPMVLTLRRN